ncbi:hypothetical protein Ahia01_000489300, partial [Argonauta hians]
MAELYNTMLIQIDKYVGSKELRKLKWFCRNSIPLSELELIDNSLRLFELLEQGGKLSVDQLDYLKTIFGACQLTSFTQYVEHFQQHGKLCEEILQSSTLESSFRYVANNFGTKGWKTVIRELGVPDSNICCIVEEYPRDVCEQIYQSFVLWKNIKGVEATESVLRETLRKNGRNDLYGGLKELNNN